MCKILNFKNVWEKINITKPKYNEKNNQKIWKSIDTKYEGRIYDVLGEKEGKLFRDMFIKVVLILVIFFLIVYILAEWKLYLQ